LSNNKLPLHFRASPIKNIHVKTILDFKHTLHPEAFKALIFKY